MAPRPSLLVEVPDAVPVGWWGGRPEGHGALAQHRRGAVVRTTPEAFGEPLLGDVPVLPAIGRQALDVEVPELVQDRVDLARATEELEDTHGLALADDDDGVELAGVDDLLGQAIR